MQNRVKLLTDANILTNKKSIVMTLANQANSINNPKNDWMEKIGPCFQIIYWLLWIIVNIQLNFNMVLYMVTSVTFI